MRGKRGWFQPRVTTFLRENDTAAGGCWRRPTLPGAYAPSTIGAGGLNGRVRDGTGCTPTAQATNTQQPRGVLGEVHTRTGHQNINFSAPRWISPRPLVRVGSTSHDAYTARLSNWSSPSGLTWLPSEESHLEASFPLRCFQRLSLPKVATRPCGWRHNRHTSASSTPVLSY